MPQCKAPLLPRQPDINICVLEEGHEGDHYTYGYWNHIEYGGPAEITRPLMTDQPPLSKEISMDTVKQSPVATIKNFARKHERKILLTTTVVSTTAAVMGGIGIKQHNEFLKERGLFNEFYAIAEEA